MPGMTFTIEPMINLGALDYDRRRLTVVTKDRPHSSNTPCWLPIPASILTCSASSKRT